jgi:RNA polymerase sigma-70 factor (ECF subfamily)
VLGHQDPEEPVTTIERHPTEDVMLSRLRSGDEMAFAQLVDDLHQPLGVLAATFTTSRPLVEDIVQETWLAVIQGLHRFQGRPPLRAWIFGILVRHAETLAAREARRSEVALNRDDGVTSGEWVMGAGRVGLWEESPVAWDYEDPARGVQNREVLEIVQRALVDLPEKQRRVVLLRDVEDVDSVDICSILGIRETHLRVLLHRGRARIRRALDRYMRDGRKAATSSVNGSHPLMSRPAPPMPGPETRPKETR